MDNRFLSMDQERVGRVITEEASKAQTTIILALFKRIRRRLGIKDQLTVAEVSYLFKQIAGIGVSGEEIDAVGK